MAWVCLHEREPIAAFCRRDIALHLYTIGDLDPFFWPYTTWYALGTLASMQIPFVGFLPIRSSEHMSSLGKCWSKRLCPADVLTVL